MSDKRIAQECYDKVLKYFKGDDKKAWYWFEHATPGLGGVSPLDMIKRGRVKKLLLYIDNLLEGNHP